MLQLTLFVLGGLVGLWFICRCLAWLLCWVVRKIFHVDLNIGKVGCFTLGQVSLNLHNGITLEVERLWFSSSFINSEIRKPFAVCIGDIRIQVEIPKRVKENNAQRGTSHSGLPSILSFIQYIGFVFDNVHVILVRPQPGCLIQLTVHELAVDWTIDYTRSETCLDLLLKVSKLTARVLLDGSTSPCVAELTLSQALYLRVETSTSLIQVARVTAEKPCIWITEGLLQLYDQIKKNQGHEESFAPSILKQPNILVHRHESDADSIQGQTTTSRSGVAVAQGQLFKQKLVTFFKYFPKEVYLQLENSSISLFKETTHRKLGVHIKDILLRCLKPVQGEPTSQPAVLLSIKDVNAGSPQADFASLTELLTTLKVEEQSFKINNKITGGFLGYHHEEVQYWLSMLPKNGVGDRGGREKQAPVSSIVNKSYVMSEVLGQRSVLVSTTVEHGTMAMATAACSGVKVAVDEAKVNTSFKLDHRGKYSDLRFEMEMMGLSSKLADVRAHSSDFTSKLHHRGTVLFVGILITKIRRLSEDITIDSMLDSVRFEWSTSLANALTHFINAISRKPHRPETEATNRGLDEKRSRSQTLDSMTAGMESRSFGEMSRSRSLGHGQSLERPKKSYMDSISRVNVQCSSVNVFISNDRKVGTMLRIDSLVLQQRAAEITVKLDGTKLAYMGKFGKTTTIIRSHEIQSYDGHIKHIIICFNKNMRKLSVDVLEETYLVWKTSLHMSIHTGIADVRDVLNRLTGKTGETPNVSPFLTKKQNPALQVAVNIQANCMVALQLSKEHRISFSLPEIKLESKTGKTCVTIPQASLLFDENEIFTVEALVISTMHHSPQVQMDREGFGVLDLPTNRAWGITAERLSIVFPHGYNFASCFDEIKNINKWRKLVHKFVKQPFTLESPLPPDLVIKIQNVLVQLCDDPFEVKLGDNYELLSDESQENGKRREAMDKRIQDLRKKFGLLPVSKIDELYASLSRKAAEVYIQRSRQHYIASPRRSKLFSMSLTNLEITALADPSLHGKDNVIKHMKSIDKESPYPEEGLDFITLWCRMVNVSTEMWLFSLRDFPMPLMEIHDLHVWGRLVGAEQMAAPRARVSRNVEVEEPWGNVKVERTLTPLKFYHDFSCDVNKFNIAYGPCWEPTIAMYNIAMNLINRVPIDPSLPLPFWDKARLLVHGRLTMSVSKMRWIYHVSLDPYNTTELMDWTWSNLVLDWTNAKWILQGDLDIYARTASKYDDCNLLHLPNLRLCIKLNWLCRGDANDHHSVMPCAPDKVPEYCHQDHDSYRAFRSDNLNMSLSFETKPGDNPDDLPRCLFYGSTLRWMDKIKMCFARVSRPIRRGKYFNVTAPRKLQLSRHLKDTSISVSLHGFEVHYWVSFARQHGVQMKGGQLSHTIGMHLDLVHFDEGLIHRPQANWSIRQFLVELMSTTIWLVSSSTDGEEGISMRGPVSKNYFLSVEKLVYTRDDPTENRVPLPTSPGQLEEPSSRHHVQIFELKGAWTPTNRNIAFSLHDGYSKAQTLKKNLSSDALKGFKVDSTQTPAKNRSMSVNAGSPGPLANTSIVATPSPMSRIQAGPAYNMLQKLVNEVDSRFVAVHEEHPFNELLEGIVSGGSVHVDQLHGIKACQQEDVLHRNWHVELYNSQVMLRGVETSGYVIVSSGKASILSREHKPVWRERQLRSKTTWVGEVEFMQYYATVESRASTSNDDVLWLSKENIEYVEDVSDIAGVAGMPEMIGSGQSVGGVVSDTLAPEQGGTSIQLQRIISRCKCQFFYAHYGEADRDILPEVPLPPAGDDGINQQEMGVNSFTLVHHDLNICTNSLQYEMILDVVNNLLLYVEPKKKVQNEKLQKMRFQLQLSSGEDQRQPILHRQNTLRQLLSNMRRLERELYMVHRALEDNDIEDDPQNNELLEESHGLEVRLYDLKTQTTALSAELAIMVSCFKENQLQINKVKKAAKDPSFSAIVRRNEVCFKHAEWRMTESDGQIGIADLVLRNFLYTKINRGDDSGSHQLELGWVKVTNLLPNTLYKDVLNPQDMGRGHSDRQMSLRILCKFKSPVGGIPVQEHFEVNIVPLTIQLTYRFYKTVMSFFFPGRNIDVDDTQSEDGDNTSEASVAPTPAAPTKSRSRRNIKQKVMQRTNSDDIDKMKERAAQNNMFLFIKIPEVPLRLSYKGSKDKNIEDLYDLSLLLPTLEYHNETWTWLDFLLAVKKDSKRILIQQAIKQKLHVRSRGGATEEQLKSEGRQAEDKVKMLLGSKLLSGGDKPHSKKSLFGKSNTK